MLRSTFAIPIVTADTLLAGSFVIATSPFTRRFHDPTIRVWSKTILAACGVELQVTGAENVDPNGRYVFVSNHQSLLDIPCISLAIPNPIRFIAKRALFKVPVFGAAMRAIGTVDIDRKNPEDAMRRIHEAERGIGQICSFLFFAEGTRSRDGELHTFKRGAFSTALSLRVPVVPVAVAGTLDILPKGYLDVRPGQVRVSIGKPIALGENVPEERDRLRDQAHAEVARLLAGITPTL